MVFRPNNAVGFQSCNLTVRRVLKLSYRYIFRVLDAALSKIDESALSLRNRFLKRIMPGTDPPCGNEVYLSLRRDSVVSECLSQHGREERSSSNLCHSRRAKQEP